MNFISAIVISLILSSSFTNITVSEDPTEKETSEAFMPLDQYVVDLYNEVNDGSIAYKVFELGIKGFSELSLQNRIKNNRYLTIVDMTVSSNMERMYIIDIIDRKLIRKTLVAHGMKTGDEFANDFSNTESSHKSSLGFYVTGEVYNGKHDLSLKLDGLEYTNNNARERGVVIHSADYVSHEFIEENGRLGRSYGCPAIPKADYASTIEKIKEGSCFFIYYEDNSYLNRSKIINSDSEILLTQSGKVTEG